MANIKQRPFNMGMNAAKRIARRADKRDQKNVQDTLGFGLPRQHTHHQELIKMRQQYYANRYEEAQRERARKLADAEIVVGKKVFTASVVKTCRGVSEPATDADIGQRTPR